MTAIEVPAFDIVSPVGVVHLIDPSPDIFDTFCGESALTARGKEPWRVSDEEITGITCLPCRLVMNRRRAGVDALGNAMAREGEDVCPCGCKYWENDHCFDCGTNWHPSFRED